MERTRFLFEPLSLGGITLGTAVSPMCQYSAENGAAIDWHLQHLGLLSLSGAGLVIVEQTAVEAVGRISHGCLGLYSDTNEAALARVVGFCRGGGSCAATQLHNRDVFFLGQIGVRHAGEMLMAWPNPRPPPQLWR